MEREDLLMYCPYCGVDHDDATTISSMEHVIPFAIGGTNDLTIRTCKTCNNNLGTDVDAPFMESFFVSSKRFFLDLASTKGNAPTLDLSGTGWIDDKEVPISYVISGDKKELKIAVPSVIKTSMGDGTERWQISGDPRKGKEILEGKLRQQIALGKTMTLEDGRQLRLEDLDDMIETRTTKVENPSVLKIIQHDQIVFIRFFSKLALAMGHLHFGESFSRSAIGESLRHNMKAQTMDDVMLRGSVWPAIERFQAVLKMIAKEDHHTVVIMEGEVPVLVVSLFGEIGAVIPLGQAPVDRLLTLTDKGTVWRIALPSRVLSKLTVLEMVGELLAPLRSQRCLRAN